ncbi:MAG: tripartite tricarboxylate transporter substrate binding protein [Comamonadaceae bacterium]|nr:MAG: tripartite tricarboxylate transporter substrate binding protein [Comamonadaceae bacterium]
MTLYRRLLIAMFAPFVLWCFSPDAQADTWPSRPVRIIVPFGSGGTADIFTRLVAQQLQTSLGQPFIVDNRPGGNFAIGTEAAAKSPADGYTLVLVTSSHTLIEALGVNRQKYQLMRDLTPVAGLSTAQSVLVVHPSVPANSVKELVALAKAQPGSLNYGSSGNGSILHLQAELLQSMTGIQMTHVPYKVGTAARVDLLAGRLQLMFDTLDGATPYIRSGKLRALGTTGKVRSMSLPDVPTIAEAGVPNFEVQVLLGLMAPTGTPKAVVDKLNAEVNKIIQRPDVKDTWAKSDSQVLVVTPDELGKAFSSEVEKWTTVVKASNIKLD